MQPADWPEVRAIYAEGIATGNATLETDAPEWQTWDAAHRADCRLVARRDGRIIGWAALSPVSDRCSYEGVAEASIYVASDARGSGVGSQLMAELIAASEAAEIWTIQAGIFPENTASLRLAHRSGFRKVGVRERLGRDAGGWRDVCLLERRSRVVGTE